MFLLTDCMGGLYCCIVACTHLGSGTGHITVTIVAPLLLTSGLMRYEAVLHSNLLVFVCMFISVCVCEGMVLIEPDKHESMLHVERQTRYVSREGGRGVCVQW